MPWLLAAIALLWTLSWLARRLLSHRPSPDAVPVEPVGPDPDEEQHTGDELDLHGVPPSEVGALVDAFIDAAAERGARWVRIVHGKGIGVRREQVRARLARHPRVLTYGNAPPPSGWGATVVHVQRLDPDVAPGRRSD